ncbi:Hypothetical protein CINCED_3A004388 [Cinara cedri]|uniref:Uncharacterized protein n=1 Tax=Cinara cedri TaxID=506608 RepID=A0A5E4NNY2_9HEMI|nr:Hypothetical protein CINCED_3A004388 [Cinara cedri]
MFFAAVGDESQNTCTSESRDGQILREFSARYKQLAGSTRCAAVVDSRDSVFYSNR